MTQVDVVVLGAGPAGAEAAMQAAECGLSVLLIDEEDAAGGQVYRAPAYGDAAVGDRDRAEGDTLRARLAASGVHCAFGCRVWHVSRGFGVLALGREGPLELQARALIVATGALERHCPVPGWTLPGVVGLAAATILLKAHRLPPGRRIVVAGSGPLLPLVALKSIELGAQVACVVDASRRRDWLAAAPRMARSSPALAFKGTGWLARLIRERVPMLSGHAVRRVLGSGGVESVAVGAVDIAWRPTGPERLIDADALCIGFGLVPSTEVTRLMRADHFFDRTSAAWTVLTDADGRTSVPGLYACGDAARVAGAAAAPHAGRLAALAAAHDLQRLETVQYDLRTRRERSPARTKAAFGEAMTALAAPREGAWGWSDAETIVCRCEGVKRKAIETAVAAGAHTVDDVKAATRCGMGACGGRVCAEACSSIVAALTGTDRSAVGYSTGRSPLRPVTLDAIAGPFEYDDLPFPAPAPL